MALRQRKAKDTILPLHNSNQEEASSSPKRPPRALTPPPPPASRKLRGGDSPTLVYRVYIPIIGVILLVVGVAYLAIGGGVHGRHHKPMEVMPKRHYHEHTAGKLKVDATAAGGDHHHHHDKNKATTVKPNHEEKPLVKPKAPAQQQQHSINPNDKSAKPFKIRCLDGDGDGYLNDDYCDCLDGSDESKTSACSHLTVSQSKFHCADGTAVIYSSRVHDGIKDCLDGSDEL